MLVAGKIYVVATPIGNLSDITLRALDILREADVILAEDTRVARKLLDHYELKKEVIRYDQRSFRSEEKKLEIVNLLVQNKTLALTTDAGTPGISDPGNELIDWLYGVLSEFEVIPIPGPSSVTSALSICGFDVSSYLFIGFLPKKKKSRLYAQVKAAAVPLVFFESPFRITKALEEFKQAFGGTRRIFIGRELTKMHEEHLRGTIDELLNELKGRENIKGEIVGVMEWKAVDFS